jgi:hypothetical protein
MNKIQTLILFVAFAAFASCIRDPSKDDIYTNNTVPYEPTTSVTLTDSLGSNIIFRKEATSNIIVAIKMKAGVTLKTLKIERRIDLDAPEVVSFNDRVDTVTNFKTTYNFNDNILTPLTEGSIITYMITVTDSKLLVATASIFYIVKRENNVLISNDIELAGQKNTLLDKNFQGLVNNFESYSNGGTGNAGVNSYYIDFVYYFDPINLNVFASPNNVKVENSYWATEIATWSRQNDTKFKITGINAIQFDSIKSNSKSDDSFYNIDFSTGSTDKITNFVINDVYAFRNAYGKVGLLKFTQVATDDTGSMKVQIICQK